MTQPTERFGIRLAVLGKTRSGKTTALYRLLSALIPLRWSAVLIFDGKRDTLRFTTADPRVQFFNNRQIPEFTEALQAAADSMANRYDQLEAGGDPAPILIVADEIQAATRDKDHRQQVKMALMLISEQSGALGDCLILASQRTQNAIPPAVVNNCNAKLTMLGYGYFHYTADDMRPAVGRSTPLTTADATQTLSTPTQIPPPPITSPHPTS